MAPFDVRTTILVDFFRQHFLIIISVPPTCKTLCDRYDNFKDEKDQNMKFPGTVIIRDQNKKIGLKSWLHGPSI